MRLAKSIKVHGVPVLFFKREASFFREAPRKKRKAHFNGG